jgi:hypothetical protein
MWIQNVLVTEKGNFGSKFLNFYYIKSPFFGKKREAYGLCQVIYLLKKSTFHFMKLLIAVESKFQNDASTSRSVKK